ncbi:MAG: intradiol ring-cleavage dioxygenase [Gaiella sp.]
MGRAASVFLLTLILALAPGTVGASGSRPNAPCSPSPNDGAGPFTRGTPPLRAKIGTGHVLRGLIVSTLDCKPIRGARVELWQSNKKGKYVRAGSGTVFTNAAGRFRFEGPFPPSYEGRPPHIHLRVTAPGHDILLTRAAPPPGARITSLTLVLDAAPV